MSKYLNITMFFALIASLSNLAQAGDADVQRWTRTAEQMKGDTDSLEKLVSYYSGRVQDDKKRDAYRLELIDRYIDAQNTPSALFHLDAFLTDTADREWTNSESAGLRFIGVKKVHYPEGIRASFNAVTISTPPLFVSKKDIQSGIYGEAYCDDQFANYRSFPNNTYLVFGKIAKDLLFEALAKNNLAEKLTQWKVDAVHKESQATERVYFRGPTGIFHAQYLSTGFSQGGPFEPIYDFLRDVFFEIPMREYYVDDEYLEELADRYKELQDNLHRSVENFLTLKNKEKMEELKRFSSHTGFQVDVIYAALENYIAAGNMITKLQELTNEEKQSLFSLRKQIRSSLEEYGFGSKTKLALQLIEPESYNEAPPVSNQCNTDLENKIEKN